MLKLNILIGNGDAGAQDDGSYRNFGNSECRMSWLSSLPVTNFIMDTERLLPIWQLHGNHGHDASFQVDYARL